jgi:modulator of FtsH protease
MSAAYDLEPWRDLMVATVGALAALTGLLFVALSINVDMIVHLRRLPGRAASTLTMLVVLLLAGVFALVPDQPNWLLGTEIAALGVLATAFCGVAVRPREDDDPKLNSFMYKYQPLLTMLVPCLAVLVGGISLIVEAGGGLYWLAGAFVAGIFACTTNAWVLLIEIKR